MKDELIENLLYRAPQPVPPPDLQARLLAEIALPQPGRPLRNHSTQLESWLRRWMPTLAFGLFLLSCLILVGVQANYAGRLRQQNETLRAASANLEQLRRQLGQNEALGRQLGELEQLRKDNNDLQRLRVELAQLRKVPQEVKRLRAENERFLAAWSEDRFFEEAQKRAEMTACMNNLKQIGLSVHVWALDNEGLCPTSLIEMSNELSTVRCLICPGDKKKQDFGSLPWGAFRPEMTSYQVFLSGEKDYGAVQPSEAKFPESILSKCPIHNNYGFADGSVRTIDLKKFHEVQVKGRWYLKPAQSSAFE
jgi:hypothetical protein